MYPFWEELVDQYLIVQDFEQQIKTKDVSLNNYANLRLFV